MSSSEILRISCLISHGPAFFRVSSDNVVVTAIHLQEELVTAATLEKNVTAT